jgi:hypothetical protein
VALSSLPQATASIAIASNEAKSANPRRFILNLPPFVGPQFVNAEITLALPMANCLTS